jgi:hypothetical protein
MRVPCNSTRGTRVRMQAAVTLRKIPPATAASPASGGVGPGGTTGDGGGVGGGGGGCGCGGCGCGFGGIGGIGGSGGQVRFVLMPLESVTVRPPAVPVTVAVFGTTDAVQSAGAVVFLEQA